MVMRQREGVTYAAMKQDKTLGGLPFLRVWATFCVLGCSSSTLPEERSDGGADTGTLPADGTQRDHRPRTPIGCTDPPAPQPPAPDPGGGAPTRDPARASEQHQFFKISVLEQTTRAPIAGARLETTNHIALTSDSNGVVAFYEPGLMDIDVYFFATHPGHEIPADGFRNRGKVLRPVEGGSGEIAMIKISDAPGPSVSDLHTRLLRAPVPGHRQCFAVRVVDAGTQRGVPLVELATPWGDTYLTDSQGMIAYCDPDHLGQMVRFNVSSHGYELAGGGIDLQAVADTTAVVGVHRRNIAERLYRITGQGIYRDSLLLGLATPLERPAINGLVMGQDSVQTALYRGKVFWIWGDTGRAAYPLGNFRASGAESDLPSAGGLLPDRGVNLQYFVDANGFSRGMVEAFAPTNAPTWLGALIAVSEASGQERLFATYVKAAPDLSALQRGLVRFNDVSQTFERVITDYPLTDFVGPDGHPTRVRHPGREYIYYQPPLRIPAAAESLLDRSTYEVFSAYGPHGSTTLDRAPDGTLRYDWKPGATPVTPEKLQAAQVGLDQALDGHVCDIASGAAIDVHGNSSRAWNPYRKRFAQMVLEMGGTSFLGELWYAEGDTPVGPWVYARKIISHEDYTFYNPRQHPFFDREGGRLLFVEGTYTKTFSGPGPATPRYDYNQIMYRLDLADERLVLPVAVYDRGGALPGNFATKQGLRLDTPPLDVAFFAPDRPAPGLLPVAWSGPECEARRLVVGAPPNTPPLFYAVAPDATPKPAKTVALYEYAHPDGRRAYSVLPNLALPDFVRGSPLMYVWENPMHVKFPASEFLGDLVAEAGEDQCAKEATPGEGADITLDASASRNLAGPIAEYNWRVVVGAECQSSTGTHVTMRLPAGLYTVELTVKDAVDNVSRDTVLLRVSP
jgi:hypothetical protein